MTKMYEGKTEEDKRKKEDNNQVNGNEYISRYYSYLLINNIFVKEE